MMTRFESSIAAVAIGITIALSQSAAAENVLGWARAGGAATFDPHSFNEDASRAQYAQVYETLIGMDSNLKLAPRLAVAWRLVEPTIWDFELRPNVRFHDGTPLTVADVVFSFMRAKTKLSPPVGLASFTESIAEVRAIGQRTVRIETRFPDPGLQEKVRQISIMSEQWSEAHDSRVPVNVSAGEENFASRHANGTGPFLLKRV